MEVAWCTAQGHGTRTIPDGTIQSAHWLETPHYIQGEEQCIHLSLTRKIVSLGSTESLTIGFGNLATVTGTGDFTKMNVAAGDEGGELDPSGADGNGNPIGKLSCGNTSCLGALDADRSVTRHIGALVYSNGVQIHEWTSFISDNQVSGTMHI